MVQSQQKKNLERAERIRRMLDQEQQKLESSPPAAGGGQPGQDQTQTDAAKQRFMVAHQLLNQAESEMQKVVQALETSEPDSTAEQPETSDAGDDQKETEPNKDSTPGSESTDSPQEDLRAEAHTASEQAVDNLQALRRLFFSVVEHLRETAQRQAQLNDETEQAATLATDDQDLPTKLGPLAPRQNELESMSGQIAEALQQQAQQNPAAAAGQQDQGFDQQQQMAEVTQKLTEAASLVAEGQSEMKLAGEQLNDEAPQVETARSHQDSALQRLAEALALLVPPQQQNQQQQDQQQIGTRAAAIRRPIATTPDGIRPISLVTGGARPRSASAPRKTKTTKHAAGNGREGLVIARTRRS